LSWRPIPFQVGGLGGVMRRAPLKSERRLQAAAGSFPGCHPLKAEFRLCQFNLNCHEFQIHFCGLTPPGFWRAI